MSCASGLRADIRGHMRRKSINGFTSSQLPLLQCAAISSKDGRWRAVSCASTLPTACRSKAGGWVLSEGTRGECPQNSTFELPHHGKDNAALHRTLRVAGAPSIGAWLPLQGHRVCL